MQTVAGFYEWKKGDGPRLFWPTDVALAPASVWDYWDASSPSRNLTPSIKSTIA